jgi:uncharacterized protein YfaT (DUF1175 family)
MRLLGLSLVIGVVGMLGVWRLGHARSEMRLQITPHELPADGYASAKLDAGVPAAFEIVEGQHAARIEGSRIVAGVLGGKVVVEARASGYPAARATLATIPRPPDEFLPLDDEADRAAFTGWFTFLAEVQFFARELPAEVIDCAALIRFAYREALREHDGRWASNLKLTAVPAIAGVRKYAYPYTPMGPRIFRTADGFAEFADAQSLIRYNTGFVSRDIRRAAPGDLLFFRQLDQTQPFHTMIYLGRSQFEPGEAVYVVYHTGPFHNGPGEIRRPTVEELLRHPSPQWRPIAGNPNFLGIYRWDILRRTS